MFTPDDLIQRLPLLVEAMPDLLQDDEFLCYLRWYTTWSPYGHFDQWPSDKLASALPYLTEIEQYLPYNLLGAQ